MTSHGPGPGPADRWWERGGDHAPADGPPPGRSRPDRLLSTAPQPVVHAVETGPPPPVGRRPSRRGRVVLWVMVALVPALAGAAIAVAAGARGRADAPTVAAAAPAPLAPRAPPVTAPRELGSAADDPCSLLTGDQARRLGYARWSARDAAFGGRECAFSTRDPERVLALGAPVAGPGSALADTYRDRAPVFTPLEVDGLPAVATQRFVGSQLCRVTVGVDDERSVRADVVVPSDENDVPISDPCGRALRGIEAVVAGLPRAPSR